MGSKRVVGPDGGVLVLYRAEKQEKESCVFKFLQRESLGIAVSVA